MEGFILNIIATVGFSGIFLLVFFLVYYLYLKDAVEVERGNKAKYKDKRLEKRSLK
jgi:hypothetical protein